MKLTLLTLEIKETKQKDGKEKILTFQWLTGLTVMLFNAVKFADAGRGGAGTLRTKGFNIQKIKSVCKTKCKDHSHRRFTDRLNPPDTTRLLHRNFRRKVYHSSRYSSSSCIA
jgi:hypothetical protein